MRFSRNLSSILWKIWKLRCLLKLLFHCTQKTDAREKHFVSNNSFERIERAVSLRRNAIEIFHETSINSLYKKEEPFLKRSFHKNRIILGRDRLSTFEKKKIKTKATTENGITDLFETHADPQQDRIRFNKTCIPRKCSSASETFSGMINDRHKFKVSPSRDLYSLHWFTLPQRTRKKT